MARYYRNYVSGGTFFFTVVTQQRQRFLTKSESRKLLREALQSVRRQWAFTIIALVLLPEHLHTVWTLPEGDDNYSLRWQKVKERFTRGYSVQISKTSIRRPRSGERDVWQPRFWEHTCKDERDVKRCVDYIHYNPLKHGLVSRVRDWPWSTFHRFVKLGEYTNDWGAEDPCPTWTQPEC
jgi:putative transposase